MLRVKTNHDLYQDFLDKLMEKQTVDEMFRYLYYHLDTENPHPIRYINNKHGDGCYSYVSFIVPMKQIEFGFYDGYETMKEEPHRISPELLIPVTRKLIELGWIEWDMNNKKERGLNYG